MTENYSSVIAVLLAFFAMTSFAKCVTVFSILRIGLGISGAGMGIVIVVLSAMLSGFCLSPHHLEGFGDDKLNQRSFREQLVFLEEHLSDFLTTHADSRVRQGLIAANTQIVPVGTTDVPTPAIPGVNQSPSEGASSLPFKANEADQPFLLLTLSFLLTELGEAFKLGLLVLIPFLIIDLVSLNVFTALGVGYSHHVLALPAKLLLFYLLNGWLLVTEKLLFSYRV